MDDALPWQVLTSPVRQWEVMPSFLIGEYLFFACALVALWHAWRQPGAERRRHLMVWVGALVAGTANDLIFMALPLVDNFWQAQATIMITPRLPLYIPCVYVWFMYLPTVAVWRLGLPSLARAALSGLCGILVYAPYDIVGAKFLWWTWHDTDGPIANRLLGAPIGSSVWVITFVASFAWLVGRGAFRDAEVSRRSMALGLGLVAGLTTILMVLQMTMLQQLDGGVPGVRGLVAVVLGYAAVVAFAWRRREPRAPRPSDRWLLGAALAYWLTLLVCAAAFRPESHQSTSVHQTVGECYVEVGDITGQTRYAFLCLDDFDEDFSFACLAEPPASGSRWYTVCGKPYRGFARWLLGVLGLGVVGALMFGYLLGRRQGGPSALGMAP